MIKQIERLNLLTSSVRSILAILNESQKTPLEISTALIGVGILAEEADDIVAELWDKCAWSDLSGDPLEIIPADDAEEPESDETITGGHLTADEVKIPSGRKFPLPGSPEAAEIVERVKQAERKRRGRPKKTEVEE